MSSRVAYLFKSTSTITAVVPKTKISVGTYLNHVAEPYNVASSMRNTRNMGKTPVKGVNALGTNGPYAKFPFSKQIPIDFFLNFVEERNVLLVGRTNQRL